MDKKTASQLLETTCQKQFGCDLKEATKQQVYKALCIIVKDILVEKNVEFKNKTKKKGDKQVYYMSMEFLVGTSLHNNLYNLKIEDKFKSVLKDNGINIEELYEMEPDAGLGNGGLGRLASCYMDSLSSLGIPATGYSIRYEFGIFKQKIIDGWQMEFPDDWLNLGDVWLSARPDESITVKFGGRVNEYMAEDGYHVEHVDFVPVVAVPYDMYISGYDSKAVNKLVLWSAKSPKNLDMAAFSRGEYAKALEENTKAEVISKILYPADDHIDGKILRLKQQYFFVSASLQTIVSKHFKKYSTLDNLADKVSVHINDTHPALCVPELMRILMDEYGYGWDDAWEISQKTLSYTNHT
ncbi:MAG: glycogen/starch/alpha-glucan phosphorylase, partial [Clostridia bacterium]|nr:glycogen/starch/alpha-glucan phosphorylase [Clostridia bacterium]